MILVRPERLHPGDRVRVVSMSGTFPKESWGGARAFCEALDLRCSIGASMFKDPGYLGRNPRRRADDFNSAVADPSVRGIFLFLGGNSAAEVLRYLDFDALRKSRKVVAGYSDHSSVVMATYARAGLVSFLVPPFLQPAPGKTLRSRLTIDSFRAIAMEGRAGVEMLDVLSTTWARGRTRGPLLGANLAVLRNLQGTPFAPPLAGHILAWEEIGEPPEDVNAFFTHFHNTGHLDDLAGMVVGHLESIAARQHGYLLKDLILAKVPRIPVLKTGAFGHFKPCFTLPLGVIASLDATRKRLIIEDAAVE